MNAHVRSASPRARSDGERGQSIVEFAFAIVVFLMLVMGIIDFGRGVYSLTGTAQAAAEIARVTSVHPGANLGDSSETAAVVGTQTRLVPGLAVTSYECLDIAGSAIVGNCRPGDWVRVNVTSTFSPVLPLIMVFGPINLTSASSAEIE